MEKVNNPSFGYYKFISAGHYIRSSSSSYRAGSTDISIAITQRREKN